MNDKSLKVIFDNSHAVAINMNDVFYWATADSSCIDHIDLVDLEQTIERYDYYAFVAYEAIRRGHDPQPPYAKDPNFINAKLEILDRMSSADEYGDFFELRQIVKQQGLKPKERQKVSKYLSKLQDAWFSFFTHR